jgi:hypothetical protein
LVKINQLYFLDGLCRCWALVNQSNWSPWSYGARFLGAYTHIWLLCPFERFNKRTTVLVYCRLSVTKNRTSLSIAFISFLLQSHVYLIVRIIGLRCHITFKSSDSSLFALKKAASFVLIIAQSKSRSLQSYIFPFFISFLSIWSILLDQIRDLKRVLLSNLCLGWKSDSWNSNFFA